MEKFQSTVLLPWPYDHQVTTSVWELGSLYVGTSSGYLFRFNSSDLKKTILEIPKNTLKVSTKEIVTMYLMGNCLLVFCDGTVYNITKNLSSKSDTGVKSATCICEKTISLTSTDDKSRYFAIASVQSISLYKFDVYLEFIKAIPVSSTHIISLVWINDIIAYVSKTGYYTVNINTLTENIISDVMEDGHLLAVSPSMDDEIMIICQNNIGIFYNLRADRVSNRNTISWKPELIQIGSYPPYMIGVSSDGSVEIYSIRTQNLYQTLHVGNFKKLIILHEHEFVISTTDTALFGFYSGDYYTRLLSLFKSKKVKDALELFHIYSNRDENYEKETKLFHLSAGLVYFTNLEFARAFQHFTLGPPDLNYLLNFWSDYIPSVEYDLDISHGLDSLAVKPIPIKEFINSKIKDNTSKNGTIPSLSINTLISLANSCLASFLLEQRKDMRSLDEMSRIDTLCFMLLSESDDKRYQLFCQPDRFTNYVNSDLSHEFLTKIKRLDILAQHLFGTGNYLRASEIISSIEINDTNIEMFSKCVIELSNYVESLGKIHSSRSGHTQPQLQPMQLELKSRIEYYLTILLKNANLNPPIVFRCQRIFSIFTVDEMLAILNQAKNLDQSQHVSEMITHFLEALVASDVQSPGKEATLASHYLENAINGGRREIDMLLSFIEGNVSHLGEWLEHVYSNQIVDFAKVKSCTICSCDIISLAANGVLGNHEKSFRDMIKMDPRLLTLLGFPSKEIMLESYSLCYYIEPNGKRPFLTNRTHWMEMSILPLKLIKVESPDAIFHLLLKLLLSENMNELAEKLLDKYARTQAFDPLEVLKILPDEIELNKVSKYFLHAYKVTIRNINMAKIELGLELCKGGT